MAVSATLSTVEVTVPTAGALPDGTTEVSLEVTARDDAGNVIPSAQVRVTPQATGEFIVGHDHVYPAEPETAFSYTSALGVATIPLRALQEGAVRYLVEVGEDDGVLPFSVNGQYGRPGEASDITSGVSDVLVGPQTSATTTYTDAQTIDAAWLTANNAGSSTVSSTRFEQPVTVAVANVVFEDCQFEVALGSGSNCLVTGGLQHEANRCLFRGSDVAAVQGFAGTYRRCLFDRVGQNAVAIEQTTPGVGAAFPTKFLTCLFRNVGVTTAGYGIVGTPMWNVDVDHCWFDLAHDTALAPQAQGSTLAAIRQVTDADVGSTVKVISSWVSGGQDYYIENVTGTSGLAPSTFSLISCRFGNLATFGATDCRYFNDTGTNTTSQGNMDDRTGLLLSNTLFPGVNATAGARFLWPQTALAEQPEVVWSLGNDPGDPGDPTIPPDPGVGTGVVPDIDEDLMVSVSEMSAEYIGTGSGGDPTTNPGSTPGVFLSFDDLFGAGSEPDPLTVEWSTTSLAVAEGQRLEVFANLFETNGDTPAESRLGGFSVPLTVTNVAVGSASAAQSGDYIVPATLEFAPGEQAGSAVIGIPDDATPEGAESFRITLGQVYGLNGEGETELLVNPGTDDDLDVTIEASDNTPARAVFFRAPLIGGTNGVAETTTDPVNIHVEISGNPSAQVICRMELDPASTATLGQDFEVDLSNPNASANVQELSPGVLEITFEPTTNGTTPPAAVVPIRIIDDSIDEAATESIIFDLTTTADPTVAVVGSIAQTTILVADNDDPPVIDPEIGWDVFAPAGSQPTLTVLESVGQTGTQTSVGIRSLNGEAFGSTTDVQVEVTDISATLGLDYDLRFDPPNTGSLVGSTGTVRFSAGNLAKNIRIDTRTDNDPEGEETFRLRIVPGPGYDVDPNRQFLTVTIRDPQSGETELFSSRIPGLSRSMMRATVYLRDGYDPSGGFSLVDPSGQSTTCQWHPVAYKPDGTPDAVHLFGIPDGADDSWPGEASAVKVELGASNTPTSLIDVAAQRDEVVASGLRLELGARGRDFELDLPFSEALIDTNDSALQGGGPRLFGRYRTMGRLRRTAGFPSGTGDVTIRNDYCTVARCYADCRADMDVVVLAVNWGNFAWEAPTVGGTFDHESSNPYVDGEVYFQHLRLENIPAGWDAVVLDPRFLRSSYDAGNNRVDIIKPDADPNTYHYLPIHRGHVAWIALYKSASVTQAVAEDVLRGYGTGFAVGAYGLDQNDAVGEVGTPMLNFERAGWEDIQNNSGSGTGRVGWRGIDAFSGEFLTNSRAIKQILRVGASEPAEPQGWWHGQGASKGDQSSGYKIDIGAAATPGRAFYETTRLELMGQWHRAGHATMRALTGEWATDEDFCVDAGTTKQTATAMGMGKSGQRMMHHHFYVPDITGVSDDTIFAPGRVRASGRITFADNPTSGDYIELNDGINAVRRYSFGAGSGTVVAIASSRNDTLDNLVTAIRGDEAYNSLAMHARRAGGDVAFVHHYKHEVGNQTITVSGSGITTTSMSGGDSTNSNVRTWNYLDHTSNERCIQDSANTPVDINLSWQFKPMSGGDGWGDYLYHIWDWPHMARMNAVTRDGWWLFLDPIAHDVATSLMHLGMQCTPRYLEARSGAPYLGGDGDARDQLTVSQSRYGLQAIARGHNDQILRQWVQNGKDSRHPASSIGVHGQSGLHAGTWAVRNPTVDPGSFNPTITSHYTLPGQTAIDRGWGWLMCTVARGYAIEGSMRPTASKDTVRDILHGAGDFLDDRPSWFRVMGRVIGLTAHKSGCVASQDIATVGNTNYYENTGNYGPCDFNARTGVFPGGDLNTSTPASLDDEWYPSSRSWFGTYINLGAYSILRRVFDYVALDDAANVGDEFYARCQQIWRWHLRLMRSARVKFGPNLFVISEQALATAPPVDGNLRPTVAAELGRYNPETGASDPDAVSLTGGYAWNIVSSSGNVPLETFYNYEHMANAFMLCRLLGTSAIADEMRTLYPGLVGAGGGTASQGAQGANDAILARWEERRRGNSRYDNRFSTDAAHIIQWAYNDPGLLGS